MNDYIILLRFNQGSSVYLLSKDYSRFNKCSLKQARSVVETIIYFSQLKHKGQGS